MAGRRGSRNAYYFFVLEKLPELKRQGLTVTSVANAIPYCSDAWAVREPRRPEGSVLGMGQPFNLKRPDISLLVICSVS